MNSAEAANGNMPSRHFDTIILGAGMSGLGCASRLLGHASYASGRKSLAVLEARDRIGGRVASVHVGGRRLDTGANWIHGTGEEGDRNPLLGILPDKRTTVMSTNVIFRGQQAGGGTHDELVIPRDVSQRLFQAIWQTVGSLEETACGLSAAEGESKPLLEGLVEEESFREAFKQLPEEWHPVLRQMPQFLENMEAGPLVAASAEEGRHAEEARMAMSEYQNAGYDGENLFLRDGFTPVLEHLAEQVGGRGSDHHRIHLNTDVRRIEWSPSPMQIHTSRGTYTADRVVCTLPLGVLKQRIEPRQTDPTEQNPPPLFSPPLPAPKTTAIDALGFGTLDKIFLVYDRAWWADEPWRSIARPGLTRMLPGGSDDNDHDGPDSFFGFTERLQGVSVHPSGTAEPGARLLSCLNLDRLCGQPALAAFVSCRNAQAVEAMADDDAASLVHGALAGWFGREPPRAAGVHVTRWARDPFARGSYSHMVAGLSRTEHRRLFADPVANAAGAELRFAGEHTSVDHFATVHGALLSGWREADAILAAESARG